MEQFYKHSWFSFKDLLIHDDTIFVSFTEEIRRSIKNKPVNKPELMKVLKSINFIFPY